MSYRTSTTLMARDRVRAQRMLRWLEITYPPLVSEVSDMRLKINQFGHRRPAQWRMSDFG